MFWPLCSLFFGRKNVCNKVKIFNLQFPNSQAARLSLSRGPQDSFVSRKVTKSRQSGKKWQRKRRRKRPQRKKVIDGNCSNCHVYERPQDTKPTERQGRQDGMQGEGAVAAMCTQCDSNLQCEKGSTPNAQCANLQQRGDSAHSLGFLQGAASA